MRTGGIGATLGLAMMMIAGCTYVLGLEGTEVEDGAGVGSTTTSTVTASGGGGGEGGSGGEGGGCMPHEINCGTCVNPSSSLEHCGGCGRSCDTSCSGGICAPLTLSEDQYGPGSIIADEHHVYWIAGDGDVQQVSKDVTRTTTPQLLYNTPGLQEIALCGDNLCGRTPTEALWSPKTVGGNMSIIESANNQVLAIAANENNVYWIRPDPQLILQAAVGTWQPGNFLDAEVGLTDIAVSTTDAYWTTTTGKVRTASLTSPTAVDLPEFAGPGEPANIAADGKNVCWTDGINEKVLCVPESGTQNETDTATAPVSIAVRDGWVYWTEVTNVRRRPVQGGDPENLASGQAAPSSIFVDETYVYWRNDMDGTVRRLILP